MWRPLRSAFFSTFMRFGAWDGDWLLPSPAMVVTILSKKSEKKEEELVEKQYERKKSRIKQEGGASIFVDSSVMIRHPSLRMGKIPSQDRPSVHFFR